MGFISAIQFCLVKIGLITEQNENNDPLDNYLDAEEYNNLMKKNTEEHENPIDVDLGSEENENTNLFEKDISMEEKSYEQLFEENVEEKFRNGSDSESDSGDEYYQDIGRPEYPDTREMEIEEAKRNLNFYMSVYEFMTGGELISYIGNEWFNYFWSGLASREIVVCKSVLKFIYDIEGELNDAGYINLFNDFLSLLGTHKIQYNMIDYNIADIDMISAFSEEDKGFPFFLLALKEFKKLLSYANFIEALHEFYNIEDLYMRYTEYENNFKIGRLLEGVTKL